MAPFSETETLRIRRISARLLFRCERILMMATSAWTLTVYEKRAVSKRRALTRKDVELLLKAASPFWCFLGSSSTGILSASA